jgi:hypothetical protein
MTDQLFTYYIENPLVKISINRVGGGIMVVWLEIGPCVISKGSTIEGDKREGLR